MAKMVWYFTIGSPVWLLELSKVDGKTLGNDDEVAVTVGSHSYMLGKGATTKKVFL